MVRPFGEVCASPWWARGGHLQTLLGHVLPVEGEALTESSPGVRRHEVELDGGDRLVVFDGAPLAHGPLDGVVVHLFHGLTGCSDSNYVRLCARVLRRSGAEIIAFNHRGQGPGEGLARGTYHSGSAPDLWASIAAARRRHRGARHIGVGFSLSGNCLLLGAGRDGSLPGAPDAALAVNPPVDLAASVRRIEAGANRVYDARFVRGMKRALAARRRAGLLVPDRRVPRGASVRVADHHVTAPMAGFRSGDAYYAACSAAPWLAGIDVPCVAITSDDDPFIAADDLVRAARGSAVHVHVEREGGHLGYLSRAPAGGPGGTGRRWLARAVQHYVIELAGAIR